MTTRRSNILLIGLALCATLATYALVNRYTIIATSTESAYIAYRLDRWTGQTVFLPPWDSNWNTVWEPRY